jgi:hypothetical protein
LKILHTRQDLVLDLEADFHAVSGILFDGEWFLFERLELAWLADINDYIRATLDLHESKVRKRLEENRMVGVVYTSKPKERMMQRRGSLGSDRSLPEPNPSDSFHLRRDSSF